MSVRYVVLLASRKCLKMFRQLRRLRRERRIHQSPRFEKIPPEADNSTTAISRNCEDRIELKNLQTNASSSLSTTPPFPIDVRRKQQRTPSVYENVNCSYDSAYDSEGLDFIDVDDNEINNSIRDHSVVLVNQRSGPNIGPWVENRCGEKENFENIWNETIETLVTLS